MSTLGKIVYLSEAQASELFANGSITVDGSTITYSADDLYLTPENIEYVKKSGDTMTGGLNMTVARIYNASYPSLAFRTAENGSNIASIGVGTNDNTMAFIQKSPDTSYYENYYLPNPASGLTSDKYYNIVTTKGSYTMSGALAAKTLQTYNRGDNYASLSFKNTTTGSDNAAMNCYLSNNRVFITEYSPGTTYVERFYLPAPDSSRTASADYNIITTKNPASGLAALGGVAKSGDTMTGALNVPGLNALGNYPGMTFRQSAGSTPTGYITENNATRRMYFTVVPTDAGGNEVFNLPAPSTGNTSQRNFDILTSKSPVTVAQGGTGATTQAGAMAVMGAYCNSSNTNTFTFENLSLLNNSGKFKYGLLYGGEGQNACFLYFLFLTVDNKVQIYPIHQGSVAKTFTGSVSGTTLTLTGSGTIYGGVRLIWINY